MNLSDVASDSGTPARRYALLERIQRSQTSQDKPFFNLQLADCTRSVSAKIWSDAEAFGEAAELRPGTPVMVEFTAETYRGQLQLNVQRIRAVDDRDKGYDPGLLYGSGWERVADLFCETLVFDIETVPAMQRRKLPPTIAESLAKYSQNKDWEEAKAMGMSPFFGKVVSLAVGDGEQPLAEQRVTVLVVPPDGAATDDLPDWVRPMSERELLESWWCLAARATTVVSYNGKGFDVPFLQSRSLIHGVPARVDLLSERYKPRPHLDLYALLTAGRALGPTNLEVVCWALGIESPKEQMDGSMVAPAYERGEIGEIALYNSHDVRATTAVYQKARELILRFSRDW
jgi:hypothetical protein